MIRFRSCLLFVLFFVCLCSLHAQVVPSRSVIDNEYGSIYTTPSGFTWADLGAYVGDPKSINFNSMNPQALKITHGRFHQFRPSDATTWSWFPYNTLKTFEANEVKAGRAPIFVTATYAGKKRPVYFSWSLGLSNNVPTKASSEWEQAVNVRDDRFIKFWINSFVRPVMWKNLYPKQQNLWVSLDECAFTPSLYGVIDDSGKFVSGVTWDSPFPQNEDEFLKGIETFFTRVHQLAPDISLMPNAGSMTWTRFVEVFGCAQGMFAENIFLQDPTTFVRNKNYSQFTVYAALGAMGKVTLLRSDTPSSDANLIRSAYIAYELLKGPNSFYAPRVKGTTTAVPPSAYMPIGAALGEPTGAMQSQQAANNTQPGYRLYWRNFEGGIVYLNWTGVSQTVTLPAGKQYYNRSGSLVTTLTIPDMTGDYVVYTKGQRADRPQINPRYAIPVTSPVTVTIKDPAGTGAGTEHYTINGSAPTASSPAYSAPFSFATNTTVGAIGTQSGLLPSFVRSVSYNNVVGALPEASLVLSADSGPAGTYYPVVALDRISPSPVVISYSVQPLSGTAVNGTLTIAAGSAYGYFPVTVAGNLTVRLTNVSGGILGTNTSLSFTKQ